MPVDTIIMNAKKYTNVRKPQNMDLYISTKLKQSDYSKKFSWTGNTHYPLRLSGVHGVLYLAAKGY